MQCPLCLNSASSQRISCSNAVYYHCSACDLVYKDKSHWLSPDQERARYLQHENTLENQGYVQMFERFIDSAVSPFLKVGSELLDFGCGPEPVLKVLLERRGYRVDTYDPFFAPEPIFANKSYDGIVCTEVFEHFYYPAREIQLLCQHLKKAGFLSVMTHLRPSSISFCEWWYRRDNTHVTFYSVNTMQWIAENKPLQLVYCDEQKTAVFQKL